MTHTCGAVIAAGLDLGKYHNYNYGLARAGGSPDFTAYLVDPPIQSDLVQHARSTSTGG